MIIFAESDEVASAGKTAGTSGSDICHSTPLSPQLAGSTGGGSSDSKESADGIRECNISMIGNLESQPSITAPPKRGSRDHENSLRKHGPWREVRDWKVHSHHWLVVDRACMNAKDDVDAFEGFVPSPVYSALSTWDWPA
jgi:hypothetical protein